MPERGVQDKFQVIEHDAERIVREWNREIEDENRRRAAAADKGRWGIVVWVLLWLLWLAVLIGVIGVLRRLEW